MDYLDTIQTLFNTLLFAAWALFLCDMLERRFSGWVSLALGILCYVMWFLIANATDVGTLMRTVTTLTLQVLFALLIFKSRWPRVLFGFGITQVIMLFSEFLFVILFPDAMRVFGDLEIQTHVGVVLPTGVAVISLLFNGLFLWVASKIFGHYRGQLSTGEWLLFAPFFVSQVAFALAWYAMFIIGTPSRATFAWLLIAVLVSIGADIALNYAMRGIAQRATLKAENAMLQTQIDAQMEHYTALTQQYENVRRMRHDIANHAHTIQILLERGETADAAAYAWELLPQTEYKSALGQCKNPVADAFLYSRITELRSQGVEFSESVALPDDIGIANSDLIIAFGNLIDNASEACRELKERRISLSAHVDKGYLIIRTDNPLPPEQAAQKKRRIPELERGVGFNILKQLAEKYQGNFSYKDSDGSFTAQLMLREDMKNASYSSL